VLNVAGRRLGIPGIEHILVATESVGEAAVVGFPHHAKGIGIYAFVQPNEGTDKSESAKQQLIDTVRMRIGDFAEIDVIQWTDTLPRTPSGKLLRVLLQRIAAGRLEDLGDAAALTDPEIVESLVNGRMELLES
jgi:acetyl-CoA synthetase